MTDINKTCKTIDDYVKEHSVSRTNVRIIIKELNIQPKDTSANRAAMYHPDDIEPYLDLHCRKIATTIVYHEKELLELLENYIVARQEVGEVLQAPRLPQNTVRFKINEFLPLRYYADRFNHTQKYMYKLRRKHKIPCLQHNNGLYLHPEEADPFFIEPTADFYRLVHSDKELVRKHLERFPFLKEKLIEILGVANDNVKM